MPELTELFAEANRQLSVCNSCRFCEGYCAVFPALERRQTFTPADVSHLANLCHDCRGCLQACMFAPPHELAIDIPSLLTEVRAADYRRYAWPGPLGSALARPWLSLALAMLAGLAAALLGVGLSGGFGRFFTATHEPGSFYRVVRYELMVVPGLLLSAYIALVMGAGGLRFWRALRSSDVPVGGRGLLPALWDALILREQGGGGDGCYFPDQERPSRLRRRLHVTLVAGFLAAFASTGVAAIEQDGFGLLPPYGLLSAPVLLGSAGGVAMIVGASGLLVLKLRGPLRADVRALDLAFLVVIDLASITGMLLLALRDTPALPAALTVHLAVLFGLYLTLPYGKLVHAVYRFAALLRDRMEGAAEA